MPDMTSTTMATMVATVWSKKASIRYRTNVVLAGLMDRRWQPEIGVGRGDRVNIPTFTQNTTATKRTTFGTAAALTFDAVTEAQKVLQVNQMAYKAFRMPVEAQAQAFSMYEGLLTDGIGEAIAIQVDSELAGDNTNGIDGFGVVVGTDNVDVTDDNILTCETNLNNADAPLVDRFAVVSPATRASLLKIDIYRNSLYNNSVGNLQGEQGPGYLGQVYTLKFYMSNNLEAGTAGKKNGVFQREAIAFAMQKEVTMSQDLNIEDGLLWQVAGWASYGFVRVKGTSADTANYGNELDGK